MLGWGSPERVVLIDVLIATAGISAVAVVLMPFVFALLVFDWLERWRSGGFLFVFQSRCW